MAQFAPKTAALIANTQASITWGIAEFSATLGQEQGIIKAPISLSFQVTNNTSQVCYIGLQYRTTTNSYNLSDRKSIAAVPANSSLNITPSTVAPLGSIGPNITDITLTLTSAAGGSVVVLMNADPPVASAGGGGASYSGLDDRSAQDYILVLLQNVGGSAPGINFATSYTVPAGKRAFLESYNLFIPQTYIKDGYVTCNIKINGTSIYSVLSSSNVPIVVTFPNRFYISAAGDVVRVEANNTGAIGGPTVQVSQFVVMKEVF